MCRIPFKSLRSNELEVLFFSLELVQTNHISSLCQSSTGEKEPERCRETNGECHVKHVHLCRKDESDHREHAEYFPDSEFFRRVISFHSRCARFPCMGGKWVIASIFPLLFCLFVLPLIYNASSLYLPLFSSVCRANLHVQFGFLPFLSCFIAHFLPL